MERLKVTRDPTYPNVYWNVRGEEGGLRAVLYNPAPHRWFLHTAVDPRMAGWSRIELTTKAACVAFIQGYQMGWDRALELRDQEDEQLGVLLP